ncbi:MAG: hypothetical protein J6J13_06455, partial [Clostridia bacterium]|nr:hypothetical protein [Clostridia bacterium]
GILTTIEKGFDSFKSTSEFNNGSFNEGFRYWARIGGGYPADFADLIETGENKCIQLNLQTTDDAITTVKFRILNDKVFSGKQLVVIYDWSGDRNFDVELTQWDKNRSLLISSGIGKSVYEAKNDTEWNTTATAVLNPLFHSDEGFYFTVKIKLLDIIPSTAKIDNIRIALANNNGVLYDLDGNEIEGVARKADATEVETAIVTTTEKVKIDEEDIESSVIDTRTIIILCSVCGAALCIIAVSIVFMVYTSKTSSSKSTIKHIKNEDTS